MEIERWHQIKNLFYSALEIELSEREEFLKRVCEGDAELFHEVQSLLVAHEQPGSFMGNSAFRLGMQVLNDEQAEVGQVLDEKYRLERLLGSGGMGAVYLATHLGTERYVALKLIAPEFMHNEEFVERFKREARAAGRLRHPNVVEVTDFGFAKVGDESVAYLVMEYLDGCTLADVLSEEKRLPVEWVIDILEQVCSAVHEAHQLGIFHRDLKPDNIWLEPNRLGNYRVKVLDFGIAKLGELSTAGSDQQSATGRTININEAPIDDDSDRMLMFDQATRPLISGASTAAETATVRGTGLTRVGAIMGTPVYMSPEQCVGKSLDARSDIYSLGVIGYQMLAGEPPFAGNTGSVIREHIELAPPALRERNTKVPRRVAETVMKALAKDPGDRPQTALAFGNSLRAQAQTIGSLYRRAFSLYSEHLTKFLKLSLTAHLPFIVTTILLVVLQLVEAALQAAGWVATDIIDIGIFLAIFMVGWLVRWLHEVVQFFAAATISGLTAVIVTQISTAPLRPVELRGAFAVFKRRCKSFLKTAIRIALRIVIVYVLLLIAFVMIAPYALYALNTLYVSVRVLLVISVFVIIVRYALYAPVVLLEGLEGKAALRRARELASRSWRTVIIVSVLPFVIPMVIDSVVGMPIVIGISGNDETLVIQELNAGLVPQPTNKIYQQFAGLVKIFVVPLLSIVPALLYLKMRQLSGESLTSLLEQIEAADDRRSKWRQRMRSRIRFAYVKERVSGRSRNFEAGGSGRKY